MRFSTPRLSSRCRFTCRDIPIHGSVMKYLAVDLSRARHVAGSWARLHGRSDWQLAKRIQEVPDLAAHIKSLTPAAGLEDGVTVLPLQALHWLSYATRPRYQDDLLDMYLYWALSRYIGLFEHLDGGFYPPRLTISEAGRRIKGNQRRVTSEEMGIGFGALLANYWFNRTGAAGLPVSIVDVDAALDDRYIFAGGSRHAVRAIKDRRPDYLLIAPDPSSRRRYRIRVLECKGTSTSISYAVRQLASAAEQLTGITVGGRIPRGLAVSTITMNNQLSYLAIDPEEDAEPSYPVNAGMIDQAAGFRLLDNVADVPPDLLANASLRASLATLADFSGNVPALDRWAPHVMRRRLARQPRERATFETPYGPARGTSISVLIDGRRLRIRYAVDAAIDEQMTEQPEAIADAQFAFAERLAALANPRDDIAMTSGLHTEASLYSATSDGSIFSISVD
jgi:hypothetical protein